MKKKRKQNSSAKFNKSDGSSSIVTKNFEIFVTDFLTDPNGLPSELKDCVLVDSNNTGFK